MQILRTVEQLSDRLLAALLPKAEASAANCWWVLCGCTPTREGVPIGRWRRCCQYADGHTSCAAGCNCTKVGQCNNSRVCPPA